MEILNQVSSRQGDKTERSNRQVAEQCILNPALLHDVAKGFCDKDKKLQSDCIEVFTMVSENHPYLIVPFADKVVPLLASKETKIRWEAAHTLAFIADTVPELIFTILPELQELIEKDRSTIVRDYTLDTIANYAKANKDASVEAFGILKTALVLWDEKHAKQVFKGFQNILDSQPSYNTEIERIVKPYFDSKKVVVVKEAKKIMRRIEKK